MKPKNNLVFIKHMLDSIGKIQEFTENIDYSEFFRNDMISSAVIRKIEILGEATANLPLDFRGKYPNIPWQIIKDMRNMLIHEYFGVDIKTVWNTVKINIPILETQLKEILKEEESFVDEIE